MQAKVFFFVWKLPKTTCGCRRVWSVENRPLRKAACQELRSSLSYNHQASRSAMGLSRGVLRAKVKVIGRWFAISCVFFLFLGMGLMTAFRHVGVFLHSHLLDSLLSEFALVLRVRLSRTSTRTFPNAVLQEGSQLRIRSTSPAHLT